MVRTTGSLAVLSRYQLNHQKLIDGLVEAAAAADVRNGSEPERIT